MDKASSVIFFPTEHDAVKEAERRQAKGESCTVDYRDDVGWFIRLDP